MKKKTDSRPTLTHTHTHTHHRNTTHAEIPRPLQNIVMEGLQQAIVEDLKERGLGRVSSPPPPWNYE